VRREKIKEEKEIKKEEGKTGKIRERKENEE
jgi:hypothetical protein